MNLTWLKWRPWRVQEKYAPLRAGIAWVPDTGGNHKWAVKLLVPVLAWSRRRVYAISSDEFVSGWHVLWVMVGVYAGHQFFDIRFAHGWTQMRGATMTAERA